MPIIYAHLQSEKAIEVILVVIAIINDVYSAQMFFIMLCKSEM
jgi:hypothetical protein